MPAGRRPGVLRLAPAAPRRRRGAAGTGIDVVLHRPAARRCQRGAAVTGTDPALNRPDGAGEGITARVPRAVRLALRVLLVGLVCHLSTQVGYAFKFPPHHISPLWPTAAILFSVLVVAPVRHWWAYILAAYFTGVMTELRAGLTLESYCFTVAGIVEITIAALAVRRFAGGLRAFDSLRSLVAYVVTAVVLAPFPAAFVAAFAGRTES